MGSKVYYKYRENIEISDFDDSIIITLKDDNSLHVLNSTASLIFKYLDNATADDVIDKMCDKFSDTDRDIIVKDVNATINGLLEKNIICAKIREGEFNDETNL